MDAPVPPVDFAASLADYEGWMRGRLGDLLVEKDLAAKHDLLRADAFLFLRGTCWRWAEIAAFVAPELAEGPQVGSVGDAHVGNFGLWRDGEGRLVWGANDFDEAAIIPYRMDLARLVTSACLARHRNAVEQDLVEAALDGYLAGLTDPRPWVLEQEHVWLRDIFTATDTERAAFWNKLQGAKPRKSVPPAYRAALEAAVPGDRPIRFSRRRAGVGSLGRPRIVALTEDAGGPIAREAKACLPSCWNRDAPAGAAFDLSTGRYRSPDPFLHRAGEIVVRRLAPNSRKIDLTANKRRVRRRLVEAMARDIGAIHAADAGVAEQIKAHLHDAGHGWVGPVVERMIEATLRDWQEYRGGSAAA